MSYGGSLSKKGTGMDILPVCLSGRRHCPPEDCGGIRGYQRFLEIIGDPTHEEHEDMLGWVGGSFDPMHFDKNSIRFDDPDERWRLAFEYESEEIETGRIRIGVDERGKFGGAPNTRLLCL